MVEIFSNIEISSSMETNQKFPLSKRRDALCLGGTQPLLSNKRNMGSKEVQRQAFGPKGEIGQNSDFLRTEWYTFYGYHSEKIFDQRWKELRAWRVYTNTLECVCHTGDGEAYCCVSGVRLKTSWVKFSSFSGLIVDGAYTPWSKCLAI